MYSLGIVQWDFTRRDHPGNPGGISWLGPVTGTMRISHMVEEHNKAPDLDRITIRFMLSPGSKNNNNRGTIEENIRVRK